MCPLKMLISTSNFHLILTGICSILKKLCIKMLYMDLKERYISLAALNIERTRALNYPFYPLLQNLQLVKRAKNLIKI